MMRVFVRREFSCSKCLASLYYESFTTGLYGWYFLVHHYPSEYCDQTTRFLWNPEAHLEK